MQDKQIQLLKAAFAETNAMTYLGTLFQGQDESNFIAHLTQFTYNIIAYYYIEHCKLSFDEAIDTLGNDYQPFGKFSEENSAIVRQVSLNLFSAILRKFGVGNLQVKCHDLFKRLFFTNVRPLIVAQDYQNSILIAGMDVNKLNNNGCINSAALKKSDAWIADFRSNKVQKAAEFPDTFFFNSYMIFGFIDRLHTEQDQKDLDETCKKVDAICKIVIPYFPFYSDQKKEWINPTLISDNPNNLRSLTTTCYQTSIEKTLDLFYSRLQKTFGYQNLSSSLVDQIRNGIVEKVQWFWEKIPTSEKTRYSNHNALIPLSLARLYWNKRDLCLDHLFSCWEICQSLQKDTSQQRMLSFFLRNIKTLLTKQLEKNPKLTKELRDKVNIMLLSFAKNDDSAPKADSKQMPSFVLK